MPKMMIFFVLVFSHTFLQHFGHAQDLRFTNIRQNVEISKLVQNFGVFEIVEPMTALKNHKFFGHLSTKFAAGIPNFNFNVTAECLEDLMLIGGAALNANATSPEVATVFSQMMDATAKISSGFQRGAHAFYGFKQECDAIHYDVPNRKRVFKTAYSRAYISLTGDCSNPNSGQVGFDICMPSSCTASDLTSVVQIIPELNATLANITNDICYISTFDDINRPMTVGSWVMVAFLSILATLAITAGITDYFLLPSETPLRKQFGVEVFLSFSAYKSVCDIMTATKFKRGQIGPINCLRVMSMFWVIYGHSIGIGMGYTNNILDFIEILKYFFTQIIENALFSVDTFFFIGGVLLSFMWFKGYEKNKKKLMSPQGWIMFYVHRIIRLSAPYWVALLTYTYLFGPLTQNMPAFFRPIPLTEEPCKKYLWKNMLYIFNLNIEEMCMGHAWYLATDMQMFVLTPVILIPLAIKPIFGWIVALLLLILSTAGNIITVSVNKFGPTYEIFGPDALGQDPSRTKNYIQLVYYAAWIRCQVYIMGLLVGWFLNKYKTLRINAILNILLWALGASLMLTVLLGLYHYNQGHPLSLFWKAAYSALSKPAWGLGLTWVVVSCYYGYGGPINQFMSWNIWVPLGRLSYCAYLVHYPLIDYMYALEKNAIYFSTLWQMSLNHFVPIVAITFTLAFILSVLVEVPAGKLEMLLLMPKPREEKHLKVDEPSWETTKEEIKIQNEDIKF